VTLTDEHPAIATTSTTSKVRIDFIAGLRTADNGPGRSCRPHARPPAGRGMRRHFIRNSVN